MREIRLYDSLTGHLVPVCAGDAIRVEVLTTPSGSQGAVDVESTRPLVLFSFLERFLQREGFGTKFLFDSPSGEDMLYELSDQCELPGAESEVQDGAHDDAGTADPGAHDAGAANEAGVSDAGASDLEPHDAELHDIEMSLLEVPRSEVDRWVNVRFGAGRDGEEWGPSYGERILLSDALKHFGHAAVALYLLGTHYSLPLGDAHTGLRTGSRNAVRIREAVSKLAPDQPSPPDMHHYVEAFRDALANDLDTPLAFVVLFEWVLEAERRGGEIGDNDLRVMLEVLELDALATPVGA